jgi:hypothetical protein
MKPYRIPITVVIILVASVALLVYLYIAHQDVRQKMPIETMKALMQLIALGIIGTLFAWVLNERSKEKEQRVQRQDALNEFRRSAVTRVVTATNVARKAPILIETFRSKKIYGEQAEALLNASLDLRLLRHDLPSDNVPSDREAFTKTEEIRNEIRKMECYLNRIVDEWKRCYEELPGSSGTEWDKIKNLPKLADLLKPGSSGAEWDKIKNLPKLADLLKEANRRKEDGTSKFNNEYLSGHENALRLMREDIFGWP